VTASLDPTVSVASPLDPRKSSSLLYRALQLFLFLHKAAISHCLGTRGSPLWEIEISHHVVAERGCREGGDGAKHGRDYRVFLAEGQTNKNQDRAEYYIELKPRLYHLNAATQCNSDPHRIDKQEQ